MNEESIIKNSKSGMICCSIIAIISVAIFVCIVIFDNNISDIIVFGGGLGILIITCIFGFIKFYKQFNNPQKYISNVVSNDNSGNFRGYLYNSEYSWDIAEANYREQHNKNNIELDEKDEEMIWKYCYSEISFYLVWLVENDFLVSDSTMNEIIDMVKNRKTTPDYLIESIDGKLSEDDVKEEILSFIDYCLNEGFESIDNFYDKISQKNSKNLTNKYYERYGGRCSYTFKWEDYDEFKKVIDKEYKDFKMYNE